MLRSTFALAAASLVALAAGCRMCAHPYDYCGPTFTADGCQQCMPNAREGSILSAGAPVGSGPESAPEIVPVPDAKMVQVPDGRGGMVLKTPDGRIVVRQPTEAPAATAAIPRPKRTATGPSDLRR